MEARRSKASWKTVFRGGEDKYLADQAVQTPIVARKVLCKVCSRKFCMEGDKKRHKRLCERKKAVSEQKGAAQCKACNRMYKSRGGLATHNCRPQGVMSCFDNL